MYALLLTLILLMEATMPVFRNPNYRQPRPPQPPQPQQGSLPAWMQGNNASQYVTPNVGQGPQPYQFTPGYGTSAPTSGSGTRKRLRPTGEGTYQPELQAPQVAPQTMSPSGTIKRLRPDGSVELVSPQDKLRYTANPQTYTAPSTPAWLGGTTSNLSAGGVYMPGLQAQPSGIQQPPKPWRIQNPDGSWAYLQDDGTYLTATGTAGRTDLVPRNSYIYSPPLRQLQPTPAAPNSPFSSYYSGWGRGRGGGGGGGGGGYSNNYTPAWMMGLQSWNFGE